MDEPHQVFLKIYKFFNGYVTRDASLYNCYYVLNKLKIAECDTLLNRGADAMCWVRDYTGGFTIKTKEQLDTLLLNDPCRLRISFFALSVKNVGDLKNIAEHEMLPNVHKEFPTGAEVYTLWFDNGTPHITKSGIANIDILFSDMASAYTLLKSEHESLLGSTILDISSVECRSVIYKKI